MGNMRWKSGAILGLIILVLIISGIADAAGSACACTAGERSIDTRNHCIVECNSDCVSSTTIECCKFNESIQYNTTLGYLRCEPIDIVVVKQPGVDFVFVFFILTIIIAVAAILTIYSLRKPKK